MWPAWRLKCTDMNHYCSLAHTELRVWALYAAVFTLACPCSAFHPKISLQFVLCIAGSSTFTIRNHVKTILSMCEGH